MTDDEIRADQREKSARIIEEDCRRNWMYANIRCLHTILAQAVREERVPEGPTLGHQ